ncbi:MAG: L,D-transpeptidase family protein [Chthoniobacterales bacterium]
MKFQNILTFSLVMILLLAGCARDTHHRLLISTADQKMIVFNDGYPVATYPVSTSKFGTGDTINSKETPLGHFIIRKKIGEGAPLGMVFKDRRPTGEIISPNAPGRDPIITRILWLQGKERQNKNAFARHIYIHGTPQEAWLGKTKSYGCIRMSSAHVAELYALIGEGAEVDVIEESLKN